MRLFVADTGPLLHLHQIGATQLLPQLGEVRDLRLGWVGHFDPRGWLALLLGTG